MFSLGSSAPSGGGGLTVNTTSANSLFGNKPAQSATTPSGSNLFGGLGSTTATTQPQSGGLFSTATSQPQQQQQSGGGLFGSLGGGNTQQAKPTGSLFGGGLGSGTNTQQQGGGSGSSLFGQTGTTTSQPTQTGSLFGATQQKPAQTPSIGGGLFGGSTAQPQQQQQQQQQQQGPTLSLFGNQGAASQQSQQATVPGVQIDLSNLVPTTKFESCNEGLKKEIEGVDTFILNQMRMCNEVADVLPLIKSQSALIPNDVEFVQGKLDTLQESLENDASNIDHLRSTVNRDAADARVAFRALDVLFLPLQYQLAPGDRLYGSPQQSQNMPRQSVRSAMTTSRRYLALPEDTETDPSLEEGGPTNLVDYFSQRADDMNSVTQKYRANLKEIENHLRGVEASLSRQLNDLSSRSRESDSSSYPRTSRVSELAATLGDVETAILGVAGRLGEVREEVQELTLGPPGATNGW